MPTSVSKPGARGRWPRRLFVGAWLALIASLLWDPFTPWLTSAAAWFSPWRPLGDPVLLQGRVVPWEPYPIATQLLWGVAVPLIPLGMMVFGLERWGRVCPLSTLMQLPRRLGLQRRAPGERRPATVGRGAWLARHYWYVQFGLLFAFLCGRLLFYNSDRLSLALFFLLLIACAVAVGALYGGKTWCNHLCPMAPVQKIFSQPGSLLGPPRQPLPMAPAPRPCPTVSGPAGAPAVSCVGCAGHCPDLTGADGYWRDLANPARRRVYFGYLGLVLGFYGYYFLYAGNWGYYLSGAWAHTRSQIAELTRPGFYIAGHALGVPKWLAAPLTLAASVLAAVLLLEGAWRLWRALRARRPDWDARLALHRLLCGVVFCTINAYYLFSGKPTLRGLPGPAEAVMTLLVLGVSGWWLWRMLGRRPAPEGA